MRSGTVEEMAAMNEMFDDLKQSMIDIKLAGDPLLVEMRQELQLKQAQQSKGGVIANFQKQMSQQFAGLGKSIAGVFAGALGPMALLSSFFEGLLEPLELITEPLGVMGEIIGTLLYPILLPINDLLYQAAPYLQKGVEYLSPIVGYLFQMTSPLMILVNNGDKVVGFFTSVGDGWNTMTAGITSGWNTFTTTITTGWDNFTGFFISGWATFTSTITELPQAILSNITNGFYVVTDWFRSLPQLILDAITGAGSNIKDAIGDWWKELWD